MNNITLQQVDVNDWPDLQTFCTNIYPIYFGDHWIGDGLKLYIDEQFGREKIMADLSNKMIGYYYIIFQGEKVGFMKINYDIEISSFRGKTVCELEKMYILPEYKGQGVGKIALETLISLAKQKEMAVFVLGVLDTNHKAISFYQKLGFQLYEKIKLSYELFKEDLKGLNMMYKNL